MAIEKCPMANAGCKWYGRPTPKQLEGEQDHGCFSDTDHILPKKLASSAMERRFLELPENKQQICRRIHDEKTHNEWIDPPELPDRAFIVEALKKARRM